MNIEEFSQSRGISEKAKGFVMNAELGLALNTSILMMVVVMCFYMWPQTSSQQVASTEAVPTFTLDEKRAIFDELERASLEASGGVEFTREERLKILENLEKSMTQESQP